MANHIDFSVSNDCVNIQDSYGEICVKCNCCGIFDEKTKYEDRIKTYKRQLEENNSFDDWWEGAEELQTANVKANAEYLGGLIAEAEKELIKQG